MLMEKPSDKKVGMVLVSLSQSEQSVSPLERN